MAHRRSQRRRFSTLAQEYRPAKLEFGKAHPDPVVETASLAAVEPPDIAYQLHLDDLVAAGDLSALQVPPGP